LAVAVVPIIDAIAVANSEGVGGQNRKLATE
jgi:hypothetical protein